jgi:hypothetical protein
VRLRADIGREFEVGAQFLCDRVGETDRIEIVKMGTAARFVNGLDRALHSQLEVRRKVELNGQSDTARKTPAADAVCAARQGQKWK